MSVFEQAKAAAAKLNPDEQFELFRWWVESEGFKARQLAALKRDIAAGIDQLDTGRYQVYHDANVMQLAEEIGQAGRKRLKKTGHETIQGVTRGPRGLRHDCEAPCHFLPPN